MACAFPDHRHYDGHPEGLSDPCPCCQARQWEGQFDLTLQRFFRAGDHQALTDANRFYQQISPAPSGCWQWKGSHKAAFRGRFYSPQHLAYMLCWGDPGASPITVLCGNDGCVNPFHLHTPALMSPEHRTAPPELELLAMLLNTFHTLSARSST